MLNAFFNESRMDNVAYAHIGKFAENKYWDKASGLLDQMGLEARFHRGDSKRRLQKEIETVRTVQKKKVVFVLAEAHLLGKETLEEFRFLLNYKFDSASPMSLILVG